MATNHKGGKKQGGVEPDSGLGKNPLLRLVGPLAYAYRWRLIIVLLILPISSLMATLVPYLTKVAIDEYIVPASQTGNLAAVYSPLMWLVALAAGVHLLPARYPCQGQARRKKRSVITNILHPGIGSF